VPLHRAVIAPRAGAVLGALPLSSRSLAMKLAIMFAVVAGLAGVVRADSIGSRPDDRASIQHADSVVAGVFTGATSRRIVEQKDAFDAAGRPYTARIAQ